MRKLINLIGKNFGELVVLARSGNKGSNTYWLCQCNCGQSLSVASHSLRSGATRSCGCMKSKFISESNTIHGKWSSPEYKIYNSMIQRCNNPKNAFYYRYGGRGIRCCDSWRESFSNFFKDIGPRPSDKHSIDRIDNNGHYDINNCRWSTSKVQHNNTSRNRMLTFQETTDTLANWAQLYKMKWATLDGRLKRGWTVEKSLTTTVRIWSKST
jgi:hypothetical protein